MVELSFTEQVFEALTSKKISLEIISFFSKSIFALNFAPLNGYTLKFSLGSNPVVFVSDEV